MAERLKLAALLLDVLCGGVIGPQVPSSQYPISERIKVPRNDVNNLVTVGNRPRNTTKILQEGAVPSGQPARSPRFPEGPRVSLHSQQRNVVPTPVPLLASSFTAFLKVGRGPLPYSTRPAC